MSKIQSLEYHSTPEELLELIKSQTSFKKALAETRNIDEERINMRLKNLLALAWNQQPAPCLRQDYLCSMS